MASTLVAASSIYYTQFFATGDSKGLIRLWDINEFQKSPIFRPKKTIRSAGKETNENVFGKFRRFRLGSAIRGLAFTAENSVNLAALNDTGVLNIYE